MGPAGQARLRHGDEIRIPQKLGPIPVGPAHGLDQQVLAPDARQGSQAVVGQHVEHFHQRDAARGRRRRGGDAVIVPASADRLALLYPVAGQIRQRPDPARRAAGGHQPFGHLAPVETRRALAGQGFQGARQIRLANDVPFGRYGVFAQEHRRGGRRGAQHRQAEGCHAPVTGRHRKAFAGGADRRRQRTAQGQAAVALRDMRQRRRLAGNARRQRAVHRQVRNHLAGLVLVHFFVRRKRRGLATIDHHRLAAGPLQQPETAAAQPRTVGLDHRQHRAHRHRRIEGVAAGLEDLETGPGRQWMGAGDARGVAGRGLRPRQQQHRQQQDEMTRHVSLLVSTAVVNRKNNQNLPQVLWSSRRAPAGANGHSRIQVNKKPRIRGACRFRPDAAQSPVRASYLACSSSRDSSCSGSTRIQSTGQTSIHWGSS